MNNDVKEIDLRQLFATIKSHLVLLIVLAISFAIAGATFTHFLIAPVYQASAQVIVNGKPIDKTQNTTTYEQLRTASELVSVYEIIITSDPVMERVIENLGLKSMPGMENISTSALSRMVKVESINETQVMGISVQSTNQRLAADIVAEIVEIAPDVIIQTVKAGSVEVVSPAKENGKVSPSMTKNTMLAALVGLALGLAIALFRFFMDNTVKTEEDAVEITGLAILGIIPRLDEERSRK